MTGKIIIMLLCASLFANAARKKEPDERDGRLKILKLKLQESRDSLQNEIAERWGAKQRAVEKREIDKEELNRLSETQEKTFNQLSSVREETYAREQRLEDAIRTFEQKQQEWNYTKVMINDMLEKEAQDISGAFPLHLESYREQLEKLRSDFGKDQDILRTVSAIGNFKAAIVRDGNRLGLSKQTLLPDGEEPKEMTVARFGNVFGYGMSEDGSVFGINQSGRGGINRYTILRVENEELRPFLVDNIGKWITAGVPGGSVPVDVLQSEHSAILTSGKTETVNTRIRRFIIAGGPVMIPLLLLPLWALLLIIIKLIQFSGKRSSNARLYKRIDEFIDTGNVNGAVDFLKKRKGIATRAASACLLQTGRKGAEQAVREVLMKETPVLGSHLNTLAVIAGVAPLLGLLGTVTGMINLFEVITRFGTGDPKLLAGGISEALITTEVGLTVAIPILLVHNYLRNRKNRIGSDLQVHSLSLINRIYPEA